VFKQLNPISVKQLSFSLDRKRNSPSEFTFRRALFVAPLRGLRGV
jgi:hypothetical protein